MAGMVWLKTENDSEHGFSKTMYSLVENWTTRWRAWDITRYGSLLKSGKATASIGLQNASHWGFIVGNMVENQNYWIIL